MDCVTWRFLGNWLSPYSTTAPSHLPISWIGSVHVCMYICGIHGRNRQVTQCHCLTTTALCHLPISWIASMHVCMYIRAYVEEISKWHSAVVEWGLCHLPRNRKVTQSLFYDSTVSRADFLNRECACMYVYMYIRGRNLQVTQCRRWIGTVSVAKNSASDTVQSFDITDIFNWE